MGKIADNAGTVNAKWASSGNTTYFFAENVSDNTDKSLVSQEQDDLDLPLLFVLTCSLFNQPWNQKCINKILEQICS